MSGLPEQLARLLEAARAPGALERLGAVFNRGAEQPGTFQRGRYFADSPEGLASQFDWNPPQPMGYTKLGAKVTRFPSPIEHGTGGVIDEYDDLDKLRLQLAGEGQLGMSGGFENAGTLSPLAKYHLYDTQSLTNSSGAGTRAYPTMYGYTLLDPKAYNIRAGLSGDNAHRINYNLASAIMRRPGAGRNLLTSHSQFEMLPETEPVRFRTDSPDAQVGTLQAEGALQLLRRLKSTAAQYAPGDTRNFVERLPGRVSSDMDPRSVGDLAGELRSRINNRSVGTIGPASLRRFGITQDALLGRPVDPEAFRGLEFKFGGRVPGHSASCGCDKCAALR